MLNFIVSVMPIFSQHFIEIRLRLLVTNKTHQTAGARTRHTHTHTLIHKHKFSDHITCLQSATQMSMRVRGIISKAVGYIIATSSHLYRTKGHHYVRILQNSELTLTITLVHDHYHKSIS